MEDIELVRSRVDIVELINSHIPLKKAGRNFKGLCPFHSEKTPSFVVSPELQIYKCFGCGEAGNAFSFLQKYENMTFGEALRFLAEKTGVKLQRYQPTPAEQTKDRLLSLNHLSDEYYHFLLTKHKIGQTALRYLLERGVSRDSIKTFGLGYAPDSWDSLQKFLVGKKGYKTQELEQAGLVIKGRSGWYDRFRGRVMFPLHDHRGNIAGFAGRVLAGSGQDKQSSAKYINTPETTIYHKSDLLYGLYQARQEIKKAKRCIVVEGELDMISSWQAGVKNVVAIKGSALTEGQVNLLKRYVDTVVLALDADMAGDQATRRGIGIADKAGLVITVVDLSKSKAGKDPDDIAQQDPKLWRTMTKAGQVIYDFYLSSSLKKYGKKTAVSKKRVTDELLPIFNEIDNEVIKSHFLKKLSQAIDISEEVLLQQMEKLSKKMFVSPIAKTGQKKIVEKSQQERLEEYLLSLVLQYYQPCLLCEEKIASSFQIAKFQKIVKMLAKQCETDQKLKIEVFWHSLPEELKPTANNAYLANLGGLEKEPVKYQVEIDRTVRHLKQITIKQKQAELGRKMAELEKTGQEEGMQKLKTDFIELSRELLKLNS